MAAPVTRHSIGGRIVRPSMWFTTERVRILPPFLFTVGERMNWYKFADRLLTLIALVIILSILVLASNR